MAKKIEPDYEPFVSDVVKMVFSITGANSFEPSQIRAIKAVESRVKDYVYIAYWRGHTGATDYEIEAISPDPDQLRNLAREMIMGGNNPNTAYNVRLIDYSGSVFELKPGVTEVVVKNVDLFEVTDDYR